MIGCVHSHGNRACCYTELAIFSLVVTIASSNTYFAYPRRDGQPMLAWVVWSNTKMVYPSTVSHPSQC